MILVLCLELYTYRLFWNKNINNLFGKLLRVCLPVIFTKRIYQRNNSQAKITSFLCHFNHKNIAIKTIRPSFIRHLKESCLEITFDFGVYAVMYDRRTYRILRKKNIKNVLGIQKIHFMQVPQALYRRTCILCK